MYVSELMALVEVFGLFNTCVACKAKMYTSLNMLQMIIIEYKCALQINQAWQLAGAFHTNSYLSF